MNRTALPLISRALAALAFAGILSAQVQFTVTPNPVVFAAVPAATQQSQTVTIVSNIPTPISVQVPAYFQPFMSVTNVPAATAGTPPSATFTLTVDTHGLAASTVPNQFLMIVGVPGTSTQLQIPINVTVTGTISPLAATPSSLVFAYQTGGSSPPTQSFTVTSLTGNSQSYTVAATSSGWLVPSANSGNTGAANTVNVNVNTSGLAVGGYDGNITVTPQSGNPLVVPVHLDVTAPPAVTITKSALSFVWQVTTGLQGLPTPQTTTLNSSNTATKLFFSATPVVDPSDPAWLVVTPTSGFTSADLQIGLNTQVVSSMTLGKHNATVFIDSPGTTPSRQAITVSFTISNSPLLTVSPASLAFTMAATGALPAPQSINVASTSSATPVNAVFTPTTGGNWATVVVTSSTSPVSTPAQVQVSISGSAQSLPAATYTGVVSITSASDRQDIPVTLTVSNVPVLSISPGVLTYSYQVGKSLPVDQFLQLTSSGSPITFTATATSTGSWIKINTPASTNLTTPASVIVSIDPIALATLAPGPYTGNVTMTQSTGQVTNILVTLNVSTTPLLQAYPAQLEFIFNPGDARVQQKTISINSTSDPLQFSVVSAGGFWLSALGSTLQTTAANVTMQVDATSLQPGIYTGVVSYIPIAPSGSTFNPVISVPVKVTVAAGAIVTDKSGLSFTQFAGGSTPVSQTINVTNKAGAAMNFTATVQTDTGLNWLNVSPAAGATPQALTVSITNTSGLPAGTTYTGAVIIQAPGASNSPQVIRVTFTVVPPQTITVPAAPLSFTSTGGVAPAAQSLALSGSITGMTYTATATTQTGGAWLLVAPPSGSLPALLSVSLDSKVLAGLAAGNYSGSIRIDSPGSTNTPQTVSVSLVVSALAPVVATVRNSASYQPGAVAPGEILYIDGASMGPTTLTVAKPNPTWPTSLSGVTVTFDGIAAPISVHGGQAALRGCAVGGFGASQYAADCDLQQSGLFSD